MEESSAHAADARRYFSRSLYGLLACIGIAVANCFVWWSWLSAHGPSKNDAFLWFSLLAFAQAVVAIYALIEAIRGRTAARQGGVALMIFSVGGLLGSGAGWLLGVLAGAIGSGMGGGAWGRPLRVRGKQLHPELVHGADWTRGDRPICDERLDLATRRALAALWLHDAQKEHASVPAFARIAWLLAAVGAPPELLRWANRASTEEIEHTERCFALAAGYGGQSFTVEPMPELLVEGIGRVDDPLTTLVYESITDGGQLEDFNADVAARCASVCEEPVTRAVLEQIATEERSHAELSWALVEWVATRDPKRAQAAAERAVKDLGQYPRPTAVSAEKRALVDRADVAALRRHGRIADAEWQAAWDARLVATRARVAGILATRRAA